MPPAFINKFVEGMTKEEIFLLHPKSSAQFCARETHATEEQVIKTKKTTGSVVFKQKQKDFLVAKDSKSVIINI